MEGGLEKRRTFEELAEGLDQLELHVREEPANVVMRLDRRARALEADALDDVRVERALQQPLDLALRRGAVLLLRLGGGFDLRGLGLEDVDEGVADDLALLLGVLDALKAREEEVGRVDDGEVHAEVLVEHVVHLGRFVQPEHAVVHHDGVEAAAVAVSRAPVRDWGVGRTHRSPMASCISFAATVLSTPPLTAPITRPVGPHMSRMRAISLPMNSSCPQKKSIQEWSRHGDEGGAHHGPVWFAAADAEHESADHFLPAGRVRDFGVELDAIEWFGVVGNGGEGRVRRAADDVEIGGERGELVAVGHPYLGRARRVCGRG